MARSAMMSVGIVALCLCAFLQEVPVVGADLGRTIKRSFPWPIPRPSEPLNYTVGDVVGWTVPPGGRIFYAAWARIRTFKVGDALVFLFINGTQDVAVVSKEAYENCEINNTIAIYSSSPTRIVLNTTGKHYYTSTYKYHCALGQKLAIDVTSAGPAPSPAPSH